MPSPFPGMNPYFEQATHWQDFHIEFLSALRRQLAPRIAPHYIVQLEEHDLSDQDLERSPFLEVRDRRGREFVTVIELLSPSNKRPGADREKYLAKRRELLRSPAHLVEIDLLRGWTPMPAESRPAGDYSVLVSRAERRPAAELWPIRLREHLPEIPIPLRAPDEDGRVRLQDVLNHTYDGRGYEHFIYAGVPEPPLSAEDAEWRASSSRISAVEPSWDGFMLRVAVVCDYPEEGWASMDLTGEKMLAHLNRDCAGDVEAVRVCPPFRRRLSRNADRLANRFRDYPRALRAIVRRGEFDLYHLADHSYSQLVHVLPPGRAVVTCHDLDTFRCLLDPAREPRPFWFRALARRILTGFQKAAAVVCNTEATRRAILDHQLIPESRLHVFPLGIHPECTPDADPAADAEAARLLGPADPAAAPELLHVGSTIPRKRIDLLLQIVAAVRRARPGARLVKAGGALTPDQQRQARDLGLSDALITLPFFREDERAVLAAVYRRAALVLQPSDAEGLGLPVIEALACGAQVLASDLPALREVGEGAAVFRDVGDVAAWTEAALTLLDDRRDQTSAYHARRAAGLARSDHFQWPRHARQLARLYRSLPPPP